MSRPCLVPSCARGICDDSEALGCPVHWARVSFFTKLRLADAVTIDGYEASRAQALVEMSRPLALLR